VTHMPLISFVEALCCEGVISYPRSFACAEIAEITADWPAAGLGSLIRHF
jgi:phosphohistidine phosphatase